MLELVLGVVVIALAYYFLSGKKWEWRDKVVIITGASSGIGREMALRLADEGAKVALAARSQELNDVVSECISRSRKKGFSGDRALGVLTNVVSEIDCKHLIDATVAKFGHVDCLILNAGISMNATFSELPNIDMIKQLMDVNFYGSVFCTQAGLPHLKAVNDSRILVVSSISGLIGTPNRTGYCASKFALHGFFESLRLEVESVGVSITLVCPSWVKTNLNKTRLGDKNVTDIDQGMDAGVCAALSLQACARGDRVFIPQPKARVVPFLKALAPGLMDFITVKMTKSRNQAPEEKK
jgi:NAD(P)-dependent dehydrogenase (short-subunit alcohol dehydrogenase family)